MLSKLGASVRNAVIGVQVSYSKGINKIRDRETTSTHSIGAAFILSVILGLIVISGVLLKPYAARDVAIDLYERVLMEKEYRELSRISY